MSQRAKKQMELTSTSMSPAQLRRTSSSNNSQQQQQHQRVEPNDWSGDDDDNVSIDQLDSQSLLGYPQADMRMHDRGPFSDGSGGGGGGGPERTLNRFRYSSANSSSNNNNNNNNNSLKKSQQLWDSLTLKSAPALPPNPAHLFVRALALLLLTILVIQVSVLIGRLDDPSQSLTPTTPAAAVVSAPTINSPSTSAPSVSSPGDHKSPATATAVTSSSQEALKQKSLVDLLARFAHNSSSNFLSAHWAPDLEVITDPALVLRVPTDLVLGGITSITAGSINNSTRTTPSTMRQHFIIDAIFTKGSVQNGNRQSLFHFPASETDYNVFHFGLSPSGQSVDLLKSRLGIRSSASTTDELLQDGVWPGWVASLPVLGVKDNEYLLDASALVANRFYIIDTPAGTDDDPALTHARVSSTRAFPRNLNVGMQVRLGRGTNAISLDYTFALSRLPEIPMTPRLVHDRIGFFNTAFESLGFNPSIGGTDMNEGERRLEDTRGTSSSSFTPRSANGRQIDSDVYLINRRRLNTKQKHSENSNNDSSSSSSVESLVYFIDPSVPSRWRPALKKGVEAWRKAFAAAGFGDRAIRAVLPGDTDWPADYDAGDIRYSTISWAVSENEVMALGPATIDPRSGEILNSDIVFTQGWVRNWLRVLEEKGHANDKINGGRRSDFDGISNHKSGENTRRMMRGGSCLHGHAQMGRDDEGSFASSASLNAGKLWWKLVGAAGAIARQSADTTDNRAESVLRPPGEEQPIRRLRATAAAAAAAGEEVASLEEEGQVLETVESKSKSRGRQQQQVEKEKEAVECRDWEDSALDEVIAAGLTSVTMHEVGHTLGLRHNFRGSTAVPFEKLSDAVYLKEHGLTSSVMDYLPLNLRSSKARGVNKNGKAENLAAELLFPMSVGKYDIAAIQYGYTPFLKQGERMSDNAQQKQKQDKEKGKQARAACFNDIVEVPVIGSNIFSIATNAPPFATDEHVGGSNGPDPLTSVFDLSSTPLAYYKDQLVLASELRVHLGQAVSSLKWDQPGISERVILRMVQNAAVYATKYIGGSTLLRKQPNSNEPIEMEVQRQALSLLVGVLVGLGPNGEALFPTAESLSWSTSSETGSVGVCTGIQQYCLGTKPVDQWSQITHVQLDVLKHMLSADRLERVLAQHEWRQVVVGAGGVGGKGARDEEKKEFLPSTVISAVADVILGASMEKVSNLSLRRLWPLQLVFVKLMASFCDSNSPTNSTSTSQQSSGNNGGVSASTSAQLCAVGAGQLDLIKSNALRPGYAAPMAVRGHVAALKRLLTRFDRGD